MSLLSEETVMTALRGVRDPEINHSIVELGMIREVELEGANVRVRVVPTSTHCPFAEQIMKSIRGAVEAVEGVKGVEIEWGGNDE